VLVRSDRELVEVFNRESLIGAERMAAMGVTASVGGRQVLAVPLHLPCCGAEALRVRNAPVLADALQSVVSESNPDAVIVAGDFNTVGTRRPLDLVRQGVAVGGNELAVVEALQLDGRSNATYWNSLPGQFPPGRLDWMLYSPSSLELLRSFVLEASDLAPEWLEVHGLEADDSDIARSSDHRPIVADFRWRR
jgi:endonuclease/exonuclease/phosphatase family metal-dependent hydrolase